MFCSGLYSDGSSISHIIGEVAVDLSTENSDGGVELDILNQ